MPPLMLIFEHKPNRGKTRRMSVEIRPEVAADMALLRKMFDVQSVIRGVVVDTFSFDIAEKK